MLSDLNELVVLGAALHGISTRAWLTVQPEPEFTYVLLRNIGYIHYFHLLEVAGEVVVVVFYGFYCAATLNLDILKEFSLHLSSIHTHSIARILCADTPFSQDCR